MKQGDASTRASAGAGFALGAPGEELRRLYVAERARIGRIVRRITGSPDSAEDLVQDAFVKLSGRNVGQADVGLVVRTAQNLARDAMRAERVRAAYADEIRPEQIAGAPAPPDEAAARRQEINDLFEALKSLPRRTQRVFLMSRLDEMSYPQIARELGVSLSTVEKDMASALEFCRRWRSRRE